MINSPLIRTIGLLNEEEMEKLHQLVSSPFFNEVHRFRDKIMLFEYIKGLHPNFTPIKLLRDEVGALLWPDRKDGVNELERVMALLFPMVKQFITFNFFAKASMLSQKIDLKDQNTLLSHIRQEFAMMLFFRMRLHEPLPFDIDSEEKAPQTEQYDQNYVNNIYRKLQEIKDEKQDFSSFDELVYREYYHLYSQVELEKARFDSLDLNNFDRDVNILRTIEINDEIYVTNKLYLLCSLMHRDRYALMFKEDMELRKRYRDNLEITQKLVDELKKSKKHLKTALITLHIALFDLLSQSYEVAESEKYAHRLSRMIEMSKYSQAITRERMDEFWKFLRTFWSIRYNLTRDKKQLLNNYATFKKQLGSLGSTDTVLVDTITSAILTALKVEDLNWVKGLLEKFDQSKIRGTDQIEMTWDIYWCLYFVHKNDFPKADRNMPHYTEYRKIYDFMLYAVAAITDTKIRLGLNTFLSEESHNMARATTTRMRRFKEYKNMEPQKIEYYASFMLFATRIARIKERISLGERAPALKQLATLLDEIHAAYVAEKEWLIAQCEAIKTENK